MHRKHSRFHIGLRTLKTVAAVIISMIIVDAYGSTSSKLVFAMLGAMAAVQPTFNESLESCLTQIVGVLFGALVGVLLNALPVSHLIATGIGIVLVITFYNALGVRFSPSLPCFMVVMICTTPDVQPLTYAVGRIWDTAIGLGVGMVINSLIFPYDNRRRIRSTMESLDREVIVFLEEIFDGDEVLPDAEKMFRKIGDIDHQLHIFAGQKLLMRPSRQRKELEGFRLYERKACQLVAHMEVLCRMEKPGKLSAENLNKLSECGAQIRDKSASDLLAEEDIVTNYNVQQILILRRELLEALGK